MAVTIESFKISYPEFDKAGDPMLTAQLAQAELEVSDSFGDSRDTAVMLRLADTLALSPWGRDSRMIAPSQTSTTYGARFQRMAEANAVSASRLGSALGAERSRNDYDG
jgi:hypothetical protein